MANERSSKLIPTDLSIQANLMNVRGDVSQSDLHDFLGEQLPIRSMFRRRLPTPGRQMALVGGEWLGILEAGAHVAAVATVLISAYRLFVKPSAEEEPEESKGLLIEIRDARGRFALINIDSEDREVIIKRLEERIRVVTDGSDEDNNTSMETTVERTRMWVKVR